MTHEVKQFAVADPRSFDGDPFEVAARACKQAEAVSRILTHTLSGANIMARNAEMERSLMDGDEARATEWDESAQGRRFAKLSETARDIETALKLLGRAAAYDPKHPPKEVA